MNFVVTVMTSSRPFTKAITRFSRYFQQLKKIFAPFSVKAEPFDDIIVIFIDEDPDFCKEIKNRDRVYQVNVGIASMESYRPDNDRNLLLSIVERLRKVIERSPFRDENKSQMLSRFSEWESAILKEALRVVK